MDAQATDFPFVMVAQRRAWVLKHYYRLYILSQELVGVWAGAGVDSRREELEGKPFEQLRSDHQLNFAIPVDEIERAELRSPTSAYQEIFSKFSRAGLLKIKGVRGRDMTLAFCTNYDAQMARSHLPAVLGSKLSMEAERSSSRPAFQYSGQTVLFYSPGFGNQLEFLDVDGSCCLWYPESPTVVTGQWRIDGMYISFLYGGHAFHTATGASRDEWAPTPLGLWTAEIVDSQPGDACGLATGRIPYQLVAHPSFRSVDEARRGKSRL